MKEFIDIIINATAADNKTEIRLTEYDGDSIFSIEVNKDENILYLDIPGDNKYDTIFEGLKKNFDGVEKSIFKSAENVNLDSILGWEKNGVKTKYLEVYDEE